MCSVDGPPTCFYILSSSRPAGSVTLGAISFAGCWNPSVVNGEILEEVLLQGVLYMFLVVFICFVLLL